MNKKGVKRKERINDMAAYVFLFALLAVVVFPLVYAAAASFKPMSELFSCAEKVFPVHPTFDNYKTVLTSKTIRLGRMFWNSTYYTIFCVIIALVVSTVNAYVFERGNFPCKKLIFVVFSALMFIDMGSITVYPLFGILNTIHLNKSLFGLIIIKALGIPIVNIYLVKSYISTLPRELDESAKIDGCSFTGIFFRILLPLLKPILATVGVFAFNAAWNEYLMPTIFTISLPEQQTLMVGINALKSTGESAANWTVMLAAAVISTLPVLVSYAAANKYFVQGLTAGAVKG